MVKQPKQFRGKHRLRSCTQLKLGRRGTIQLPCMSCHRSTGDSTGAWTALIWEQLDMSTAAVISPLSSCHPGAFPWMFHTPEPWSCPATGESFLRSCDCSVPGGVQGWLGPAWSMEAVPAQGRGSQLDDP